MKRINKYVFIIFLLLITFTKVSALEVSKSDITIEKGGNNSVELYANVDEEVISVTFTLVYSTYDIPASFSPANGMSDTNPNGITHTIVFNEAKSGKILLGNVNINVVSYPNDTVGTVNIHTASAKKTNEEVINLNAKNINIKVGTPTEEPKQEVPKEVDKNMLDKIESKLVKIELKKDVFDYTVTIDKDVTELDLKPVAKDEKTKIDIGSQKISELKDNKIVITTKNGETTQVYNIKVNIKEIEDMIKLGVLTDKVTDYLHTYSMVNRFVGKEDSISHNKSERFVELFMALMEKNSNIELVCEPFVQGENMKIHLNGKTNILEEYKTKKRTR